MDAGKWVPTALLLLLAAPTATASYVAGALPAGVAPVAIPALGGLVLAAIAISHLATGRLRGCMA